MKPNFSARTLCAFAQLLPPWYRYSFLNLFSDLDKKRPRSWKCLTCVSLHLTRWCARSQRIVLPRAKWITIMSVHFPVAEVINKWKWQSLKIMSRTLSLATFGWSRVTSEDDKATPREKSTSWYSLCCWRFSYSGRLVANNVNFQNLSNNCSCRVPDQ